MASQYSQSQIERPSRSDTKDLPWDECDWPTTGRYRDLFWATKNGMTVNGFREWVYSHNVPYRKVGSMIWIDAEDMDSCLPKETGSARAKTLRAKKRKSADAQAKDTKTRKR
jgi:hypothetical protein